MKIFKIAKAPNEWQRVKWTGNDEKPYCDWECWAKKFPRPNGGPSMLLTLYPGLWPTEGWSYVCSDQFQIWPDQGQ